MDIQCSLYCFYSVFFLASQILQEKLLMNITMLFNGKGHTDGEIVTPCILAGFQEPCTVSLFLLEPSSVVT